VALPRLASAAADERHEMVAPAVFLDRDGVLTANVLRDGRPVAPTTLDDFRLLPGVEGSVRRLKIAGFTVVVVTNQPDLATGRTSLATLNAMHSLLRHRVLVDHIKVCPHVDADGCRCRKPNPGLLLTAAEEHGLTLADSYMVGDRWSDVAAGQAAGCTTILLVPQGSPPESSRPSCHADAIVTSLSEAVDVIMAATFGRHIRPLVERTV
jgi:D-glycero-D-manno-heptose 1,7-bisphosphate phosphatase